MCNMNKLFFFEEKLGLTSIAIYYDRQID